MEIANLLLLAAGKVMLKIPMPHGVTDIAGSWSMVNVLKRFAQDESGATAIEYGLIASLIAVALIAGASLLGNDLNNTFTGIAGKLTTP